MVKINKGRHSAAAGADGKILFLIGMRINKPLQFWRWLPVFVAMPRMLEQKDRLAFSYSGLKTHMVNVHRARRGVFSEQELADICAAFQQEAFAQLVRKLEAAAEIPGTLLEGAGPEGAAAFVASLRAAIDA